MFEKFIVKQANKRINEICNKCNKEESIRFKNLKTKMFNNLGTPDQVNELISNFAQEISPLEPFFIECTPEQWSRTLCCNLNVNNYISQHEGEMLSGYIIWYNGKNYVEAERHAIWKKNDIVRDVSFVQSGETKILFLPDTKKFEDGESKIRFSSNREERIASCMENILEKRLEKMRKKLPDAEMWEMMESYSQWINR